VNPPAVAVDVSGIANRASPRGVTCTSLEYELTPAMLLAATLKVYVVPFVRLLIVNDSGVAVSKEIVVQDPPPDLY
jgi:hypothetical protein